MVNTKKISEEEVFILLKEIIADKIGVDQNQLTPQTRYQDDLAIDSLDQIELQMEIEKKFSILIHDEESEKLTTIGATVKFILKQRE